MGSGTKEQKLNQDETSPINSLADCCADIKEFLAACYCTLKQIESVLKRYTVKIEYIEIQFRLLGMQT